MTVHPRAKPARRALRPIRARAPRRGASTISATTIRSNCSTWSRLLEEAIGKKANRELLPMQPGDVPATYADVDDLMREVGFQAVHADRRRHCAVSSPGTATIIGFSSRRAGRIAEFLRRRA